MAATQSAFELHGLPAFLPDETLFSLCSRYHVLSGALQSRKTSSVLYGHPRAGLSHDWPSGLPYFVAKTREIYGTARQLIHDRTLLPFYLVRASKQRADEITQRLERGDTAHLKYQIGALTGGLRAHHPLRACPNCMQADLNRFGIAYWHRSHQWPGVLACATHRTLLYRCTRGVNGVLRYQWQLPTWSNLQQDARPEFVIEEGIMNRLCAVANLAEYWSTGLMSGGGHRELLYQASRQKLEERNWLTATGRIRLRYAAPDLHAWLAPLRPISPFTAFPPTERATALFLTRIFSDRSYAHPLRHIVLLAWLFGSPSALRTATDSTHGEKRQHQSKANGMAAWRQRLLISVCEHGISISAAAAMHHVSVATAQRIVADAGHAVPRRPKFLKMDKTLEIRQLLLAGKTVDEVASSTDLSVSSINRVLASDLDLKARWKAAAFQKKRKSYRSRWQRLLAKHPGLGFKLLRELQPATYIWLYRHDRVWLQAEQKHRSTSTRQMGRHADWTSRDADLAHQIRKTASEIDAQQPGQRIRLQQLLRAIDNLHPNLARLDYLPRTRLALQAATARHPLNPRQQRLRY